MPNPTLQDALKEAYASAPANIVVLDTLEFRHPNFSVPVRIVKDSIDWSLTLEPDAPADPGEAVNFTAWAFALDVPPVENNGQPEAVVTLDNVTGEILLEIEAAAQSAEPVLMTYRPYLSDDASGPQMDPPLHLVVTHATATPQAITLRAGYGDYSNRKFPGREYTLTELENKAEPTGDGGMFSMPLRSRGTGRVSAGNLQGATTGVESLW